MVDDQPRTLEKQPPQLFDSPNVLSILGTLLICTCILVSSGELDFRLFFSRPGSTCSPAAWSMKSLREQSEKPSSEQSPFPPPFLNLIRGSTANYHGKTLLIIGSHQPNSQVPKMEISAKRRYLSNASVQLIQFYELQQHVGWKASNGSNFGSKWKRKVGSEVELSILFIVKRVACELRTRRMQDCNLQSVSYTDYNLTIMVIQLIDAIYSAFRTLRAMALPICQSLGER